MNAKRYLSGWCCASLLGVCVPIDSYAQAQENVENLETMLVQVAFSKVDFIHTGELANYTARNQRISFSVLPRELKVTQTGEDLLRGSPDAFFAVRSLALTRDDRAHSAQYCLDILRSLAVSPNPDIELIMFLNVSLVTGTNFDVHTINSCSLQSLP